MILLYKVPLIIFALLTSLSFAQSSYLQLGDSYYTLRAENSKNNMANGKNVKEAIKYYNLALEDSSTKEEAAWKLLRAYYFLGCFTMPNTKDREIFFADTKKQGKSLFLEFPENPEIAYWYSVNLALWASTVNPITAWHAGSVTETREIAQMLMATEKKGNKISAARGYQILGRAHHKIPNIIFVLNWVKRDSSEYYLKKSMNLNPNDLVTRLFLAEYYKEIGKEQEAENLLLPVIKNRPRYESYLEDERNFIKMRRLLPEL